MVVVFGQNGGELTLSNITIDGNHAGDDGGGLVILSGSESLILSSAHHPALFLIHDGIVMLFSIDISPSEVVGKSLI